MDSKCADSCRSLKKVLQDFRLVPLLLIFSREIFKSCILVDYFQNRIPLTRMLPGLWSGEHSRRSCEQIFFCWWAPCLILYVVYYVLNIKERLLSDKVMRLTACTSLRWVVVFNVVSLFPCCCCSGKVTIVCLRLGLGCSAKGGVGGCDLCQDFLDKFQAGTLLVLKKLDGEEEEKTVNEVEIFHELKWKESNFFNAMEILKENPSFSFTFSLAEVQSSNLQWIFSPRLKEFKWKLL